MIDGFEVTSTGAARYILSPVILQANLGIDPSVPLDLNNAVDCRPYLRKLAIMTTEKSTGEKLVGNRVKIIWQQSEKLATSKTN